MPAGSLEYRSRALAVSLQTVLNAPLPDRGQITNQKVEIRNQNPSRDFGLFSDFIFPTSDF